MTPAPATAPGRSLGNERALVTGGLGGIGLGIALALAEQGAAIIIHDLDDGDRRAEAEKTLRAAGAREVEFVFFDLRDVETSSGQLRRIRESMHVDILVNNAGVQRVSPLASMTRESWDTVLATNLSAAFDTMRCFLPGMAERGYGRVVNVSSVHGLVASVDKSAYVAAKHGLIGLTRAAALEYAASGDADRGGVTVNAICPGWVETPLIEAQVQQLAQTFGGDQTLGAQALLSEKQPSLRFTRPGDVGALVVLLCSPALHNLTGAAIPVDGGWTAQ